MLPFKVKRAVPYLQVRPLEKHLAFYQKILGYEIVDQLREADGSIFWAQLRNGDSNVMLSSRPVHNHARLTWLYVDDVDTAYTEFMKAGGEPFAPPADQSHQCREFLCADPSGHIYVISQPL